MSNSTNLYNPQDIQRFFEEMLPYFPKSNSSRKATLADRLSDFFAAIAPLLEKVGKKVVVENKVYDANEIENFLEAIKPELEDSRKFVGPTDI